MASTKIKQIMNLWSLGEYPPGQDEWSWERKVHAVADAGFDGIIWELTPEISRAAVSRGLMVLGFLPARDVQGIEERLSRLADQGARHVNVQLGAHDTTTEEAYEMASRLMDASRERGIQSAIETHRDTCTETPEKTYALAEVYEQRTGELLPLCWDFSHLAVVKHLMPPYEERLLVRPDLVRASQQFHLRPFNGHHCQIPVTDGRGGLTAEFEQWKGFCARLFGLLLEGGGTHEEIYLVPEMGPVPGGYNLSRLPNSWEDAVVLKEQISELWQAAVGAGASPVA